MTAYAKPIEEKRVVMRVGPRIDGTTALADLRSEAATGAATAQPDRVAFSESRRSGNIAVAVVPKVGCGGDETEIAGRIHQAKPYLAAQDEAKPCAPEKPQPRSPTGKPGNPAWRLKGATKMSQPASKSPVGMPAAAAAIGKDGQLLGAPGPLPPGRDVIADIMEQSWGTTGVDSAGTSPRPTMHRAKIDPQLARIIDAWPGLSAAAREAVVAILDGAAPGGAAGCKTDEAAVEAKSPQPESGKDRTAAEAGEPRRRRTRKAASPPPPESPTP